MTNTTNDNYTPVVGAWYLHQYGGVYRVLEVSTESDSPTVKYEHRYPFEHSVVYRPLDQWTFERYKPISRDLVAELLIDGDVLADRERVTATAARTRAAVKVNLESILADQAKE